MQFSEEELDLTISSLRRAISTNLSRETIDWVALKDLLRRSPSSHKDWDATAAASLELETIISNPDNEVFQVSQAQALPTPFLALSVFFL